MKDAPETTVDMCWGLYRRIFAGFISGRKICSVPIDAEAGFWRIQAKADDFGNVTADPVLLRNAIAGRRDITVKDVERWIADLTRVGLIAPYSAGDEKYLHIIGFEARQPAGKNGKRIQKVPRHPPELDSVPGDAGGIQVNPGESNGIQNNPGDSRASLASHSHSHSHSEDHSEKDSCPAPPQAACVGTDTTPIVLTFPTKGRGGKEWHLRQSKLAEYTESFPAVDVLAETRKARQWAIDNPTKQKTPAGMPAFLSRWLGKVQNQGGNQQRGSNGHPNGKAIAEHLTL